MNIQYHNSTNKEIIIFHIKINKKYKIKFL